MNDQPITVRQAAMWFGVTRSTIWMWVNRGKLSAVGQRGPAKLYRFADLAAVERTTRNSPAQRRDRHVVA